MKSSARITHLTRVVLILPAQVAWWLRGISCSCDWLLHSAISGFDRFLTNTSHKDWRIFIVYVLKLLNNFVYWPVACHTKHSGSLSWMHYPVFCEVFFNTLRLKTWCHNCHNFLSKHSFRRFNDQESNFILIFRVCCK